MRFCEGGQMRNILLIIFCLFVAVTVVDAKEFNSTEGKLKLSVLATGLENPWGMDFLPDGKILVTERAGRLRIIDQKGSVSKPVTGLPELYINGQGGLLDVLVDPQFEKNNLIYFSYSEPDKKLAGTAVAKAELKGETLENVKVIFRQTPKVEGKNHWGSRLALAKDGTLFITLGDRFDYSEHAQDLTNHLGKVVRINTDGTVPKNNPFVSLKSALPEIWSYGHRNVQGASIDPSTGKLWTNEHGPKGGDELNLTIAGENYGWPLASYGSHYSGEQIPDEHAAKGFREPVYYWVPSIATSGLLFYTDDKFPSWKGSVFVGALAGKSLVRLGFVNERVTNEERLITELGERIRDVGQGKDGWIYIITDEKDGKLIKIEK